ncbi:alpha/beta fold hydrolase [Niveispirillum fermenti]|uniref:alpha/beta fold hydrolase n=1 Tax=Niveispirillum fermenti TaxID=1233113 RepID=UPI003A87E8EF
MTGKTMPVTGKGTVTGVPDLPPGFTDLFTSVRVDSGRLCHHVVQGGDGPPLLMLAGWPQCWFAWRHLMPALAAHRRLVVADPRGVNLSDRPMDGYDSRSQALDMFALMDALGYGEFDFLGHDIGMWTGFAMARSAPERLRRLIVGEAMIPGVSASPPLLPADRFPSDLLSHFNFNRLRGVNELLVSGREHIYFGHQFATKAGRPDALSAPAKEFYIDLLRDPDALRASFEFYRALDISIPQNQAWRTGPKITIPVATFAGRLCVGDGVELEWRSIAEDVTSLVIEDCGHYPAEEKPEALLAFVDAFLRQP